MPIYFASLSSTTGEMLINHRSEVVANKTSKFPLLRSMNNWISKPVKSILTQIGPGNGPLSNGTNQLADWILT